MNSKKDHKMTQFDSKMDIKRTIEYYLSKWKWFLLGFFLSVGIALVYLRYTTPEYESRALIRLITLNNNPTPEEAILGELGLVYGGDKLHTDEIQILKSRSLIENVVRNLQLYVQVYSEGNIKDREIYSKRPVRINLFAADSILYDYSQYFEITVISDSEFVLTDEYGVEIKRVFGSKIDTNAGALVITPSEHFDLNRYNGVKLKILIKPVKKVAEFYRDKLTVYSYNDRINRSNMIGISITDPVPEKAATFINELIKTYNDKSIENKQQIAQSTYDFINERVASISSDLSEVDSAKESFKVGNMLTDVNTEAGMYVQAEASNEIELIKVATELSTVNAMIAYLNNNTQNSYQTLPTNLGEDQGIASIASQYNQMVIERNSLLNSSGEKNPVVLQLNERLKELYNSLMQSLVNLKNTLLIRQSNLLSRAEMIDTRISSVPSQERENRVIQRQQNIKESIYLYLLQKREESAITTATAYPSAEVIDPARINDEFPVFPKRKLVLLASGLIGLIVPFVIFFLNNILNTKILELRDLNSIRGYAPVIGELPGIKEGANEDDMKDLFSEALRILRTNLDFIFHKDRKDKRVIFITSSVNGEGKTFIAYNLAKIYTYANNKVLLVGADIRKPNLHELNPLSQEKGISNYLNGDGELDEIVESVEGTPGLFILHSGSVPPNPSELLMNPKVDILFSKLRENFDIVIVDTAPTMLVTDTMIISKYADQSVYIVRAGYTEKELLPHIGELAVDEKLPGMVLVLNDVNQDNLGYSGKYGKVYNNSSQPWYRAFMNRFR
ncbi:GumC family protein [Robertkochia flava]|uniref:GumC family protein n=1 Tax=Robertkochia flava TaxID=3447986 RepID=UPI001CCC21C7|nr:polysaccharide biosynthesis tyrosine autokinase [Robertkochia marina]